MISIACLVGGIALVVASAFLSRMQPPVWENDNVPASKNSRRWYGVQRGIRFCNNVLMLVMGLLMIGAGLVTPGEIEFVLLWFIIGIIVLLCLLLAFADASASLLNYRRVSPRLPESTDPE